ncbi:MAG TPA: protocatechuate 3,4-dioxygenase subunit alpha [Hyphomicrobiaceae bacterium]|nr:protocatechuate 3,4-dioxygenase subunit alpha [Hyphomicrobiaceae bacterium]
MNTRLDYLRETPSQTAGPYVHIGLIPEQAGFDIFEKNFSGVLTTPETPGEHITIEGRVFDGSGAPIRDVLLEIWQADSFGKYPHPADARSGPRDAKFRGWGRTGSNFETGLYTFETVKPGKVPGRVGKPEMAPHISFWIVARGINIGLQTRMYFADETEANAKDPILNAIELAQRRKTLIAERTLRDGKPVYTFDIKFQSEDETVFFDI